MDDAPPNDQDKSTESQDTTWSTTPKINSNRTTYKPVEMTDESVYRLASLYLTADEIAEHFNVTKNTVLSLHGDAFHSGKSDAKLKPRVLMNKLFKEYEEMESLTLPRIVDVGGKSRAIMPDLFVLHKFIELHAKKYEGMGQTHNHVHSGKYDAVEDAEPEIIERAVGVEEQPDEDEDES